MARAGVLSLSVVLAGALVLCGPEPSLGSAARPPAPNLSRIHWKGAEARAPLEDGGEAVLTLDFDLQRSAESLLARAWPIAGAVVAIDVASGKLRVFASFTREDYRGPPPLFSADAPAASIFKLVTTATLLERTPVTLNQRVCSSGGHRGIERRHLQPPNDAHQHCAPFFSALGFSRNAAYAQLVTRHLARDDLVETAEHLGFNARLPFELGVDLGRLDVPFGDLEFARTAVGFENSWLNPVGAAHLALSIATRGYYNQIHVVEKTDTWTAPPKRRELRRALRQVTANRLIQMMEVTVYSGTARPAFTDADGHGYFGNLRVAGKTGTLKPAPEAPATSWFTGFAPSRSPEIVVAVLLRNARVWRREAKEVARDVLRAYFSARGRPGVTAP
ncbi:MAG TPA: penicillin-binding transpeptidase domain-containing protein [Polyangiaceae bacterium]